MADYRPAEQDARAAKLAALQRTIQAGMMKVQALGRMGMGGAAPAPAPQPVQEAAIDPFAAYASSATAAPTREYISGASSSVAQPPPPPTDAFVAPPPPTEEYPPPPPPTDYAAADYPPPPPTEYAPAYYPPPLPPAAAPAAAFRMGGVGKPKQKGGFSISMGASGTIAKKKKSKKSKKKFGNVFGAAAEEEEIEEMPAEAAALMKNRGSATKSSGCQSTSGGYFYAKRPWEVDGLNIKDDNIRKTQTFQGTEPPRH